ncbi:MAG: branched-chain amino acid ABC transporter permease [Candidatus Izemoplasmataceae bacterium]
MTDKTKSNTNRFFGKLFATFKKTPSMHYILFGLLLMSVAPITNLGLLRNSMLSVFAYIVIYTVVVFGLNLLLGFSKLISLATASFIGAGALSLGIFLNMGLPFEVALILILLISIVFGAIVGILSLKSQGIYLAITTLFIQEILRQIFTSVGIFGGERINIGAITFLGSFEMSRFDFGNRMVLYYILVVFLVAVMIIFRNLIKSRSGRAFMAMSRSQSAASAMGVSVMKYRVYAFIIATMLAMLGGVLYGIYFQSAPTRAWSLDLSLMLLAMVVVGGFKSIFGMFLGAFIIQGIPSIFLEDIFGDVSEIFAGILIIVIVLYYPQGLIHSGHDIKRGFKKLVQRVRKKEVTDDE